MHRSSFHGQNIQASRLSFLVAFLLAVMKAIVGMLSGSLSVMASSVDSFLDMIVSAVNYFTIKTAAEPPDKEHPYGHGKFEALSELFQGIIISASGIYLAWESVRKIMNPIPIEQETLALGVMGVSFVVTLGLVLFLRKTFNHTGSIVLKADSMHYQTDLYSNGAIIGGLLLTKFFGWDILDGVLSFFISGMILWGAWPLLRESFYMLTDREIESIDREKIIKILDVSGGIEGWHALRTRRNGSGIDMDVHLEFSKKVLLVEAHDVALDIENKIQKLFPQIMILTHFDTEKD